jgi:hypothetical protein
MSNTSSPPWRLHGVAGQIYFLFFTRLEGDGEIQPRKGMVRATGRTRAGKSKNAWVGEKTNGLLKG